MQEEFFFFLLPVLCPIPTSQGKTICQHLIPRVPKPDCTLISLIISFCNLSFLQGGCITWSSEEQQ